ncbi:glycosyl transferase [Defluviimonas sp. 20V17]|nr:glycosyl transferase [Defluviimonas sp. 20V17]
MLIEMGALDPAEEPPAVALAARQEARLADILFYQGLVGAPQLLAAQARLFGTEAIDPHASPPDPRLIDRFGAHRCLREALVPWARIGGAVMIATARPEMFERHRAELRALFGPVVMRLAPEAELTRAVLALRAPALSHRAEGRVAEAESCRPWQHGRARALVVGMMLVIAAGLILAPAHALLLLGAWASLAMTSTIVMKAMAALAMMRGNGRPPPRDEAPAEHPQIARLPCVSIMVPLYHEPDIAPRLIRRLGRLDYPRELLDVLLLVEAEDRRTLETLRRHGLPPWMRVAIAPAGKLKTKPRALNFGLDLCRGSIVGVWDAEDAPDPQQIHDVVRRFHERGAEVACLQGQLDYFNPRTNWLARCFTIEYATWFRVVLPGIERLGLAIPLGGTTLFFRRAALEALDGWDAHNVTEDADLGMRLARHGYRAEMIETVTGEEANCRLLPWIRQRSRWLKGFMMTWAVHNRAPRETLRQLGWKKFLGLQVLLLATLSQVVLAPVSWSFWLLALGLAHPLAGLPAWAGQSLIVLFLSSEAVNLVVGVYACRGRRHRFLIPWVPTLTLYFPLATLAAYKALWELVTRPFYWDKTAHGLFDIGDLESQPPLRSAERRRHSNGPNGAVRRT